MTEKMTVHKALSELKIINDRITSAIDGGVFCLVNKHNNEKINGETIEEAKARILANRDRVADLIKRRDAIKRAVVLSNAVTKVTVAGKEYTVAEAIDMKNTSNDLKLRFCKAMDNNHSKALMLLDQENGKKLEERADNYVIALYGQKDGKTNSDEIQKVRDTFIKQNTYEIIDPIGIDDYVKSIKDDISNFFTEIDSALSVSNALTEIEINY